MATTSEVTDEGLIEALSPRAEARIWRFGSGEDEKTYVQRKLGFFQKMEWYSLVSRSVDEMLQQQGGTDIAIPFSQLFGDGIDRRNMADMTSLFGAVAKLSSSVPDFLAESFCIWLGVPREERIQAMNMLTLSPEDGGPTDEDGLAIIETFVEQNGEAIRAFFGKEGPRVLKLISTRLGLSGSGDPSPSPKPSRATRRATQKG